MRRRIGRFLILFVIVSACVAAARAQVAQGGDFTLNQSVIAAGGGRCFG